MELTEIGKDCKKQIWSWGKSGAQFCDLEHKTNHVTSQLRKTVLTKVEGQGQGHVAGSFSIVFKVTHSQ